MRDLAAAEPAKLAELEAVARRLRDEVAAAGRAEALERVAAKLRGAMKAADLRRAEPDVEALMQAEGTAIRLGSRPVVPAALLAACRHAMLAFHRMRLHYGADPAALREHVVEPLGLLHGQRPYLVAQITDTQQGPSVLRLDRVHEHVVLADAFVRDPAFSSKPTPSAPSGYGRRSRLPSACASSGRQRRRRRRSNSIPRRR